VVAGARRLAPSRVVRTRAGREDTGTAVRTDTPLVFLHVMKCGGTSIRSALASAAAGGQEDPRVFELDGQAAIRAVDGDNRRNWAFRDALLRYVLASAPRPAVVLGHFRFREEHVASLDSAHFVTVLRDPVDRLVSLYRYRRWKEGVDVPFSGTLAEFLETPRWQKEGHLYVDTFCGRDGLDPRSDEAVDAAVVNLRRFAAVGVLDRLGQFAAAVGSLLGAPVAIPVLNTTPAPAEGAAADADGAELARAREICAPDARVYEAVRDLGG
jgi:Sulfotransferase family